MLDIKTIQCNMLQENCYVVSDATHECVIIDCGAFYTSEQRAVVDYITKSSLKPMHLLCTHGHFDHVFGCPIIYDVFGLKPEIHPKDENIYNAIDSMCVRHLGSNFGLKLPPVSFLTDRELIHFGTHQLKVYCTPGHSPGSVIFYCEEEKVAFSGDTLFRMSVGRTDLEYGSWRDLNESLHTVLNRLPGDTLVYPGHGPKTIIQEEIAMNPFLR